MTSDYYPAGVSELPNERDVEKEYIFEVRGEIKVVGNSEKDAEYWMKEDIKEVLYDAYVHGDLKVI